MVNHGVPLVQQITVDIVAPPIGACLWWLFSRAWAGVVQGGKASETTKNRQSKELWIVLGILYLIMFGTTAYYNL